MRRDENRCDVRAFGSKNRGAVRTQDHHGRLRKVGLAFVDSAVEVGSGFVETGQPLSPQPSQSRQDMAVNHGERFSRPLAFDNSNAWSSQLSLRPREDSNLRPAI